MRAARYAAVGATLLATLACDKTPEPKAPTSSVPPRSESTAAAAAGESASPSLPDLMKRHFTKSTEMEAALIRGKLDEFKEASVWLAEHQISVQLPVSWEQHVDGMTEAARASRDAADVNQAGFAFGSLGRACATCHEQLGGPKITVGRPPAEGSGAQLHMLRHQWAAERMWEGLMAPSDEAWIKGSEVLSDAPLGERALAGARSVPPKIVILAKQVHGLGNTGRTVKAEDRGKIYGQFLATCAVCHDELGVTMK
ncbi:MAG: hypothetical protein KC776_06145 [Myxococcales bacterium]|nr:hypothetical protein [Myxococcales bacterium]MCB9579926.1 hypothetical protein [Polyangiaceae bacterium]